jgi:hypothetical protein
MARKKTTEPQVVRRRIVGINVIAGGRAQPHAYLIYEEDRADGTIGLVRGYAVYGSPASPGMLRKPKKGKPNPYAWVYAPHLFTTMWAACLLNQDLQQACVALDEHRGIEEI